MRHECYKIVFVDNLISFGGFITFIICCSAGSLGFLIDEYTTVGFDEEWRIGLSSLRSYK